MFLKNIFCNTASAINEILVFEITQKEDKELSDISSKFIGDVFNKMQPTYRLGILMLAIYFNFIRLLFYRKSPKKLLERWQRSRLSPKRDFVNFFMTLTIVAVYDSQKELKELGVNNDTYLKLQCFYNSGVCS